MEVNYDWRELILQRQWRKHQVTKKLLETYASAKLHEFNEKKTKIKINVNKIECVGKMKRKERDRARVCVYVCVYAYDVEGGRGAGARKEGREVGRNLWERTRRQPGMSEGKEAPRTSVPLVLVFLSDSPSLSFSVHLSLSFFFSFFLFLSLRTAVSARTSH